VDETGYSGDTGSAEGGAGGDSRDRTLLNGWASSDSPWSGSALDDDEDEIPAWRRSSQEIRPFTRQGLDRPSGEIRPFPEQTQATEVRPFGSPPNPFGPRNERSTAFGEPPEEAGRPVGDSSRSGDVRPPEPAAPADELPPPRWSDSRTRYADLLNHFSPVEPTGAPAAPSRPGSLEDALDAPPPTSAPPYPYEGDLDDSDRRAATPVVQQRAAVPLERPRQTFPAVRPATPGGRRADWTAPESARHALDDTAPEGSPPVARPDTSAEPARVRTPYDPDSFPRRLPYNSVPPAGSVPPSDRPTGYASPAAYPGSPGRSAGDPGDTPIGDQTARALPQRVPAEPDVPTVPEPPSVEPPAETPALARIATHLRRGDVLASQDRQEGFDVNAILEAVREVDGVRDASLRTTPAGAHSLRLDLAEGADPAEVSRHVARLLQDRMGLDAAMQGADAGPPPARPVSAMPVNTPPVSAFVPSQPGPSGRASVTNTGTALSPGDDLRRLPTAPQAGRAPDVEDRPAPIPISAEPVISAPPVASASAAPVSAAPASAPPVSGPPAPASAPPAGSSAGTVETVADEVPCRPPRPLKVNERPAPRVMIENVQVNTFGTEATVEVRLGVEGRTASGVASGPAVDGYLMRLCAMATAEAVDELLLAAQHTDGPAKCFIEHAAAVPFGAMQVAVVVMLLSCGGWVEQLAGSAVVTGDDRHAMVRATLAAVNRRLEALLS
jgi:hypothetical protein